MKFIKLQYLLILITIGVTSCKNEDNVQTWRKIFEEKKVTGTFVLKNLTTNKTLRYNEERSKQEYCPASTFKILNSMIALQEQSVKSINDTIKWDGVDRGYKLWNNNQTMKTALPISCVWFYQNLARRTGKDKMQHWLTKANYGNRSIGNEIDQFWLNGTLTISANQQIHFLERLIKNELPFDKKIQETVKEIMITDSTEKYTIYSKTGWSNNIGWNIGYVETKSNKWIFALNIDMDNIKLANVRKKLTYDILKERNIIEQ